jgi:hypothetical protein
VRGLVTRATQDKESTFTEQLAAGDHKFGEGYPAGTWPEKSGDWEKKNPGDWVVDENGNWVFKKADSKNDKGDWVQDENGKWVLKKADQENKDGLGAGGWIAIVIACLILIGGSLLMYKKKNPKKQSL